MPDLQPSESTEVPGSGTRMYVLKNTDGVYSCSCMAWTRQRVPSTQRTCKHLKRFRGEEAECERIAARDPQELDIPLPQVLDDPLQIADAIAALRGNSRLWLDTEVADWQQNKGRLSLIQALPEGSEPHSGSAIFLDVLDRPELTGLFIRQIMMDHSIEKVFHNASFDKRYLGKDAAVNVICTLQAARALPVSKVSLPSSLSLKSLTEHFGLAESVSKEEQTSDWGQRPLSVSQLKYAALDVVYLRGVHLKLLELASTLDDPASVSIVEVEAKLLSIEPEFSKLKSEREYLRDLLHRAMVKQNCHQTSAHELATSTWAPLDVELSRLAELIVQENVHIDSSVRLTKEVQTQLGPLLESLQSSTPPTERLTLRRRRGKPDDSTGDNDM